MPKNYKELLQKTDAEAKKLEAAAKAAKTALDQMKKLQEEAKKLKGANVKDADLDA